jgi:hypothetical protein
MKILNITIDDKVYKTLRKFNDKYVSLSITELKNPDQYGNTHTVYQYNKETKEKAYCGKGKVLEFMDYKEKPCDRPTNNNQKGEDVPF